MATDGLLMSTSHDEHPTDVSRRLYKFKFVSSVFAVEIIITQLCTICIHVLITHVMHDKIRLTRYSTANFTSLCMCNK
jgi:hypothetical protein